MLKIDVTALYRFIAGEVNLLLWFSQGCCRVRGCRGLRPLPGFGVSPILPFLQGGWEEKKRLCNNPVGSVCQNGARMLYYLKIIYSRRARAKAYGNHIEKDLHEL